MAEPVRGQGLSGSRLTTLRASLESSGKAQAIGCRGRGQAIGDRGVITSGSSPCVTTRGPAPRGASLAAGREPESARAPIWAR